MTKVTTPQNEDCPNCPELESTECIVEEESLPALGLPAGSRLNIILKYIDKKIKDFTAKFKKVIYNVEPIFDTGIPIFTYTEESCGTNPLELNVPLFLNGKECFEYDLDTVIEYVEEDAYVLFFNHTHCGGNFIGSADTIQITHVSGVPLSTPLIIKNPGDTSFVFDNATLLTLLGEINTITTSTFTDIVTDAVLTVNNDVGLGLVPTSGAGATFLGDLTFTYEHLDGSLVLVDTIVENILSRPVSGFGMVTTTIETFSVEATMGNMTFYDESLVEVTDPTEIEALIQLIVNEIVRPVCCPDCGGGSNLSVQDEGVVLTNTADSINFVGDGVEATNVGNDTTVTINSPKIVASDEGTPLTTEITSLDFVGDDIAATNVGGAVTVTVTTPPGGTSLFKEVVVPITAAEMRQMHITKKELLPDNPALAYNIESIILVSDNNGTIEYTYVGGSNDAAIIAQLSNTIVGDVDILTTPAETGIVAGYLSGISLIARRMVWFLPNPSIAVIDGSINLRVEGEMSLGDSDFTAIVTYREVTL